MSSARDEFTAAFNKNRTVLASFAKCESEAELHAVRDGFYLGMAKALSLHTTRTYSEPTQTRPSAFATLVSATSSLHMISAVWHSNPTHQKGPFTWPTGRLSV